MRILVFDVPADAGGALTILQSFHAAAAACPDAEWTFVLGEAALPVSDGVSVQAYPWVKTSWFHRLFFDVFCAGRIAAKAKPDVIFSLQNMTVRTRCAPQVLYVHQSIPFSDLRFSPLRNPREWAVRRLLAGPICRSARAAAHCVVQTEWMRDALARRAGLAAERISVVAPECDVGGAARCTDAPACRRVFFYPAAAYAFKNHRLLIQAARLLVRRGIADFTVELSIEPTDTVDTESIAGLPQIHCVGQLRYEQVLARCAESTLVFPSKLETFGLPLLEAALLDGRVLASDKPFSREILAGYPNAAFFDADSAEALASLMARTMSGELAHQPTDGAWYRDRPTARGWQPVLRLLQATAGKPSAAQGRKP